MPTCSVAKALRLAWAAAAAVLFVATTDKPAAAQASNAPSVVELRAGDRIAFVGDSFFEREYPRGLIETALTVAHPEKALTFRNLGWSGDTVRGESRAYFGKAADGYGELLKSVDLVEADRDLPELRRQRVVRRQRQARRVHH